MRKVKYPELGKRIREARINLKLKQKDCLSGLGDVTPQMLSDWENGYVCPSLTYLINISNFYKVSLDYIILGKKIDETNKEITTYKDAIEYVVQLHLSGIFEISSWAENNGMRNVCLNSFNKTISDFEKRYRNLLIGRNSMRVELFNEALLELIDEYNIPYDKN